MGPVAQRLLNDALTIPESERAELAAQIIESLDPECDEDAQARWAEEIQRRLADLDGGLVQPIPWVDARHLIREALDGARAS